MTLTLSVLRCPDTVPPETKRITGGELRIGRGHDNDWIMPDPERMLSKKHCVIAYRNGGWAIADTSTNGTFLNNEPDPIGQGQIRNLADGDRIRLGAYEIEVRIAEEQGFGAAPGFGAKSSSPFDDPFGDDVFAQKPAPAETFTSSAFGNDPLFGGPPPRNSVTMPNQFDPLAPASDDDFFSAPTQPDHSQSFSDAFKPPPVKQQLLPDDDWDLGFPAAAPSQPPAPPPPPERMFTSLDTGPDSGFGGSASPFAEPAAPPAPIPAAPPQPNPFEEDPFAPKAQPQAQPPAQPPQAPPAAPVITLAQPIASATPDAALTAFLEGAGMHGARPENAESTMRAIGAAFRATVSGIRQALIARAEIKGGFRIEQTMIRSRGNNPLKFSADDDDALSALLGIGRRIDMKPEAAVADALRDMRLHELATMAAMQDAVRALLAQLDPARLRAEADEQGGLAVLPTQKKARAFEAYEKLHDSVTRALADDFDSVFGKTFARAYETALRDISAREPS
ncbi:phosphopeptide-binding protein [Acidocella aquatica]|uniref:Phosphopeptide-binding protein n=1 Tax=Acidocella aquatica TaxID=1922313 RepID=A0ABQ5ZZL9_9PROT|nr:type VI secretion system-associated FHA domain protein TagH [Acidocella aquatica]GLR65665.1 phosphopeptide-binding protein [Acidocella aquatica]